jgi:tRNA(Ile2) C34 agmatinyltransferase TiaS
MASIKTLVKVVRCPICRARMTKQGDGSYVCPNCGEVVYS